MNKYLLKYFPFLIILFSFIEIITNFFPSKLHIVYTYLIEILFGITCLLYYISNFKRIHKEHAFLSYTCLYMLIYLAFGFIKQWFIPSGLYPFFRMRISLAIMGLCAIFIFLYEEKLIFKTFQLWWKYVPFVFILTFWKLGSAQYILVLAFVLFFLSLLPLFNTKRKIIIIAGILFIAIGGMEQRMDYINMAFSILLLTAVKYIKCFSKTFFMIIFRGLMFIPLLFVILFFTHGFNILQLDQFIDDNIQTAGQLNVDTRSFLYEEAWLSSINNDYLIQGRTPLYGYDSYFAEYRKGDALIVKGQKPQRISEVFIVNTLTWFGIIGVAMFFLFYYKIGIKTLNSTRNLYLAAFSIYIAFFWIESWIGHILFTPDTSYILLCIVIAMCLNTKLQKMNTQEMKVYLRKLLNN